jgi:hypothetical protein
MRNVLAIVPKGNQEMVAAAIRTIFAQPDAEHVLEQFEVIATMLGKQLPKVEQMLREAREDLVAFTGFPAAHWKKIWSTNPLERLHKEVKRTDVVGVFPNPAALVRLAGAVLVEAHDEWQVSAERRYLSERSMVLLTTRKHPGGGQTRTPDGMIRSADPHGVEKLHHSAGRHRWARLPRSAKGLPATEGSFGSHAGFNDRAARRR